MSRCLCYLKTMRKRSLLLDCCLRSLLREQQAVIWWVCRESRVPWLTNIFSRLSIFFFLLHFAYIYAFPALVLMYREPPELVRFQSSQNWAWFIIFSCVWTVTSDPALSENSRPASPRHRADEPTMDSLPSVIGQEILAGGSPPGESSLGPSSGSLVGSPRVTSSVTDQHFQQNANLFLPVSLFLHLCVPCLSSDVQGAARTCLVSVQPKLSLIRHFFAREHSPAM